MKRILNFSLLFALYSSIGFTMTGSEDEDNFDYFTRSTHMSDSVETGSDEWVGESEDQFHLVEESIGPDKLKSLFFLSEFLDDKSRKDHLKKLSDAARECLTSKKNYLELLNFIEAQIAPLMQGATKPVLGKRATMHFQAVSTLLHVATQYNYAASKDLHTELTENGLALNSLTRKLEQYFKENFASPLSLDNFYDLDEEMISDYIFLLRGERAEHDASLNKIVMTDAEQKTFAGAAFNQPVKFNFDSNGNLIIAFTGDFGVTENLRPFGENLVSYIGGAQYFSQCLGLNGDKTYLQAAEKAYILVRDFLENSDESNLFEIKSLLAKGKKVRLIGHGSNGIVAEVVTYKLKKLFTEQTSYSDNNQIQAISFGSFGFLHDDRGFSDFNNVLGNDVIRLRFVGDTIAPKPCRGCVELPCVLIAKNITEQVTTSYFNYQHALDYFVGNFINTRQLSPFRQMILFYRLLQIEGSTVAQLIKVINKGHSKGSEEQRAIKSFVTTHITNMNRVKASISSLFFDKKNNDALYLNQIHLRLVELSKIFDDSDLPESIQSISTMVARKAFLIKRMKAAKEHVGKFANDDIIERVATLVEQLKNSNDKKDFSSIINLIGQTPSMLISYDQILGKSVSLIATLENYLVEESRRDDQIQVIAQSENKERLEKYLRAMAKAKLNVLVGGSFKSAGGATGTLLALDVTGKPIGIFKQEGYNNILKRTAGQRAHLSTHNMAQPLSECAAYLLSLKLKFDIAPITTMTVLDPGNGGVLEGAFMEFVPGSAAEKSVLMKTTGYKDAELKRYQMMAFFDYLIGNYDRHCDNFYINHKDISTIICIDNANAFPVCGPNKFNGHNMYKWKEYNISGVKFTDDALAFVADINNNDVDALLVYIDKTYPNFLDNEIKDYLWLRLKMLRTLNVDMTPKELAELRTRSEINQFLGNK